MRVVLLVLVIATSQLVTATTVDAGIPALALTFEPDPPIAFEPMTVGVAWSGCAPGDQAIVELTRDQWSGDMPYPVRFGLAMPSADSGGNVQTEFEVAVAYPGEWKAVGFCPGPDPEPLFVEETFDVVFPPEFSVEYAMTVRVGEPFALSMTGGGCHGDRVRWQIASWPGSQFASGETSPRADGSWRVEHVGRVLTGEISTGFRVWCSFADGVDVYYRVGGVTNEPVTPGPVAEPPTSGADRDLGEGLGEQATPRFTG